MTHVDALSRAPVEFARDAKPASLRVLKTNIDDSDWLYSMQLQDSKLKEIINKLKKKTISKSRRNLLLNMDACINVSTNKSYGLFQKRYDTRLLKMHMTTPVT